MDVRQMIAAHIDKRADVTVAAVPVPLDEARSFGVLQVDDSGRIASFHEKVKNPPPMPGRPNLALASMGNYVFRTGALLKCLEEDARREQSRHDFGHDILPMMVERGEGVYAYDFQTNDVPGEVANSYWRDIGTVDAYFAAHMDLVQIKPQFNLYNRHWPIRTGITHDPPAKFVFRDPERDRIGTATDSIVSLGCIISGGRIHRAVLGSRCRVNSFSEVEESVLLENVNVGRHAKIRRAIIDKDVEIPPGARIGYDLDRDRTRWYVSEGGVVVIPKRSKIDPEG
jgi:glucose-1-phosphate adenylyltransferase